MGLSAAARRAQRTMLIHVLSSGSLKPECCNGEEIKKEKTGCMDQSPSRGTA